MKRRKILFTTILAILASCGGDQASSPPPPAASAASSSTDSSLTPFETAHGIGPVKQELVLSAVDQAMVERGKTIFESKCAACHKLDSRYVGPELGTVLKRRSPTFVMNMILNSQEMVKRHPEAKKMLGEYLTVMPFQNVSEDDARALLEYLRSTQQ